MADKLIGNVRSEYVIIPHGTLQECSKCSHTHPGSLSEPANLILRNYTCHPVTEYL